MHQVWVEFANDWTPDFGLDEDEGWPMDDFEIEQAETLGYLAQTLSLEELQVTIRSDGSVVVSSGGKASEPHLRYFVYASFLPYPRLTESLKLAARSSFSAIISHLFKGKTIYFEFHKPSDTSLSSVIALYREQIKARPEMAVGALHKVETKTGVAGTLTRVVPVLGTRTGPFIQTLNATKALP